MSPSLAPYAAKAAVRPTCTRTFCSSRARCSAESAPAPDVRRKRVIFSGIQPTGVPHIGNHLGALSQWQKLVREVSKQPAGERDSLFFSVVGLHALTVPQASMAEPFLKTLSDPTPSQDPATLRQERHEMFAVLLALGLDAPEAGAVIFHQDQVSEHAELAWYLNCVTSVSRLMRMTSWKASGADDTAVERNC